MRHICLMTIQFRIRSLTSSAGETATLPTKGVTCIVGGNNAGKSQLLREIHLRVQEAESDVAVVTLSGMAVKRPSGRADVAEAWLAERMVRVQDGAEHEVRYEPNSGRGGSGLTVDGFTRWFDETSMGSSYLGNIPDYFVRRTSAGSLSEYAAGSIGAASRGDTNRPLARMFRDGSLEEELSALTMETFGQGLVLDRINPEIRLRVGSVNVEIPPLNRPSVAYANAVAALPTLDSQGDGFRSFVGLALLVMAEQPDVLLVDEPEAFLHPGQARALGRWLAGRAASHDHQIILATHDRDIVLGLIEGASKSSVTFVRLTRDNTITHMTQLSPADVEHVWDQPALRYSNVLQGLFHKRVVMCEGDGDCRFYGAALDELAVATGRRSIAGDVLFVPSGGKAGVPKLAAALTSLGVEARAIMDFDLFRTKTDIRKVVESLGTTWTPQLNDLYTDFVKEPNSRKLWDTLKHAGLAGVPGGPSYAAAKSLLAELGKIGLYVVPVGEMEDFDKSLNVHGPAWVSAALASNDHVTGAVSDLVEPILNDL